MEDFIMGNLITVDTKEEATQPKYVAYGTAHFVITREQIQDLLDGKYLVDPEPDEYGTFISLEE